MLCRVDCYGHGITDKRIKARIGVRLTSKYRSECIDVSRKCPVTDEGWEDMIEEIINTVQSRIDEKQKKKSLTQELRSKNQRKYSPNAYTRKVLKDKFDIDATEFASPKDGTAYMMYDLPFTDFNDYKLYTDKYKEFREEFLSVLDQLSNDFGFKYYDVRTPSEGSVIRGKWQFVVYGPDVVVNKSTGEASVYTE